jgi:pyruvate,water dikinase
MVDAARVGQKNASLGEMLANLSPHGIKVPMGFATTAEAFRMFLAQNGLGDGISKLLTTLEPDDLMGLARTAGKIRASILATPLPNELERAIREAWRGLTKEQATNFAVRSSATAEDLPEASFAGQQETLLNVKGVDAIVAGVRQIYASLFSDRAIAYRAHRGFAHMEIALSAGIQRMVRTDLGASGVAFTLDTESGFRDVVLITSTYGLGESLVQGAVNPDEFCVYKPALRAGHHAVLRRTLGSKLIKLVYGRGKERIQTLTVNRTDQRRFSITDDDVLELARQSLVIEQHYGCPMDIEWGKDGLDGCLYILQARPETVESKRTQTVARYSLKQRSAVITTGCSIGQRVGTGTARIIRDVGSAQALGHGDVLITDMTDPAWEPVMRRAAAIVTDRGGRTCHAAILARELGVPAVVGCGNATNQIGEGDPITVSCAEGDKGYVYEGVLEFEQRAVSIDGLPETASKLMINVADPGKAFALSSMPISGVGLARLEFIINRMIGVHPLAVLNYDELDRTTRRQIDLVSAGYADPVSFFVEKLAEGIATIGAAFAPRPVIVRLSDFKSNEYADMIGGTGYEPCEENPMLGFRGASRYLDDEYRPCFELECRAIRKAWDDMGLTNIQVMVPFVRTVDEARRTVALMALNGLEQRKGLKIIMMCELPNNALLAGEYLDIFDGMSIGSNDLTQLTLGLDRDSGKISSLFDERNAAVKQLMSMAINACRATRKYIGICGQGPSDHPDLAKWLTEQGIDSISLDPDAVFDVWLYLSQPPSASNEGVPANELP